jgi:Gas vesicle synthesis protein GvpL/GvpF
MSDSELHVHGIVRASERVELPEGSRLVPHGDVAAVVSETGAGELVATQVLRRHWRVLEDVGVSATVLPVRFGTVMASERAVVDDFLAPRHDRLVAELAELADKVQLTVKGTYEEAELMRTVVERSPAIAGLRERVRTLPEAATYYDRIELGRMVAAEVERERERDSQHVIGRLEPLAVAVSHETQATPEGAVNASFLVERGRVDEFSAIVAELGRELEGRIGLRYVGPLPPFSFAGEDAEAPAWA